MNVLGSEFNNLRDGDNLRGKTKQDDMQIWNSKIQKIENIKSSGNPVFFDSSFGKLESGAFYLFILNSPKSSNKS